MRLAMAIDILERADMSVFVVGGGVECQVGQLRTPDHPVFSLKDGELTETRVRNVQRNVHCKIVELPLNFHQVMIRYAFRTPGKGALSRQEWLENCSRYKEVDRALRRGEASADARAMEHVAFRYPLGSDDTVVHAHRAVAVEAEGPQARGVVIPAGAMIRETCGVIAHVA